VRAWASQTEINWEHGRTGTGHWHLEGSIHCIRFSLSASFFLLILLHVYSFFASSFFLLGSIGDFIKELGSAKLGAAGIES
jgi:hypothetical protein